ncbi:MAG TPA: magnesium-translocating P-type ATPase [Rickettsiales bacterium]|nr:magnesium-translocating P-type ATPase [Rickettsiales bacterium]
MKQAVRNIIKAKDPVVSETLVSASKSSIDDAIALLETGFHGLTEEEVLARRERYGANEVAHDHPDPWYKQLAGAFVNPFIGVLAALIGISLFTDVLLAPPQDRNFKTIIVLLTMILISSVLRFWQEYRSGQAAEALKAMVRTTATVTRKEFDRPMEVSIIDLVPGDIVKLSAGDMIPADVRLLTSRDLFISQAVLTGESIPVEKYDTPVSRTSEVKSPLEMENVCFMGTNVVTGSATALVVATGKDAYFGTMAREITGTRPLTSFDIGINKVSWVLIRFMFIMVPIVFFLNGLTKNNWTDALLFAVSVAVGLTPEMLPMVVTANLARGAVAMAKRKTIVKHLNSIQNFGAMDILCTDKTGTLTQDKIILEKHLDIYGEKNLDVLKYAYLNSYYQTGLKNVLDVAVLNFGDDYGMNAMQVEYRKVDEIPFDFVRRRMSVIVRSDAPRNLLVCKGAVEEVLSLCVEADDFGKQEETDTAHLEEKRKNPRSPSLTLDEEKRKEIRKIARELNEEGLRVLAVAYKWLPPEDRTYNIQDETQMVLAGYIAFLDPPKETALTAISALKEHGVAVKIITGDNEIVTRKICKEVGLDHTHIIMGKDIDTFSDEELAGKVEETTIFAKMSPIQKSRIIRSLQSLGHTVGYMGDGINDAAALRDADVGISVDTAVDIAKESADIILLEKSLMVLEEGVLEGRKTFGNIIKYIKMTASSNFGNVFSVLIASAFLPFLPMLAIQLLVQNLLYDISQISIPWDNVDMEYMDKPRKWEAGGIARFMMLIGPLSSIFDVITFCVMWYVFKANTPEHQGLFQSGWFVEGLLSQTLVVHMIRTQKIPFFQSRAALPVITLTLVIMAIGIYIPFSPLGESLRLASLPLAYFGWLVAILLGYCIVTQTVKTWYVKKFGEWM